jgi:hypothetical protein
MTTTPTPLIFLALVAPSIAACRIGGATEYEQPSLDVHWWPDSGDTGEQITDDTASPPEDTTPIESGTDGGSDAVAESDGKTGDEDAVLDGAICTPSTPDVCDPVQNTGCASGSRCTTSSTPNTGRCVYLGPVGEGGFCTATDGALGFLGTDTCVAKLACLSNKCVALCWCDSDCKSGSCCNVAFGTTGFKGCGSCP